MFRTFFCLLIAFFCVACSAFSDEDSDLSALRSESNQTYHFRPVHPDHDDWMIARLGRTLTLKNADVRVKISFRGKTAVVRRDGVVVGRVAANDEFIAVYRPVDDDEQIDAIRLRCHGRHAEIFGQSAVYAFRTTSGGIAGKYLEIRKLPQKHRYSVIKRSKRGETCDGFSLETPFSALGLAVFLIDDIPIHQRMGMAAHITKNNVVCD